MNSASLGIERLAVLRTANALLSARHRIAAAALGAALLIIVLTLLSPRTYTSSIVIQPQARRAGGGLSGLVAQLGVNIPATEGSQPLGFYADLARSQTILRELVKQDLPDSSGRWRTLIDYYEVGEGPSDLREYRAVQKLLNDLHVTANPRTGVILIEVTLRDARLALFIAQKLLEELDTYNLKSRQSQARLERRFSEARVIEARQELRAAEDRMRQFLQANHGPRIAPDLKFEEDGLTREIGVRQQVYTTLMQLYEQARLEEVRDTPVLMVVEPAVQAPRPDSKGFVLKAVVAFFAGLGVSIALVLIANGLTLDPDADPVTRFHELRAKAASELRRLSFRSRFR